MSDPADPEWPPLEEAQVFRAAGACVCPRCGRTYRKHLQPYKEECPTIHQLCGGRLVKT